MATTTQPQHDSFNSHRPSVLGHVSFGVRSYEIAKSFYTAIFEPLGLSLVYENAARKILGYGVDADHEVVNIFERGDSAHAPGLGTHIAFNAASRQIVDEFFAAGICHGWVRAMGSPEYERTMG